jgi:predicted GNAT family acetyltransferase
VTAAVVDAILAEGQSMACLYLDLHNLYSNRCYAKIGFRPLCRSSYYPRVSGLASGAGAAACAKA